MFKLLSRAIFNCNPDIRSSSVVKRFLQIGSDSAAYAGDGKTTVTVINNNEYDLNFVNTYSHNGFRLQNNLFIYGSIILFPTHVFSWSVKRGKDINLDSLLLFDIIVPKVKIVVIGYGDVDEEHDYSLPMLLKKKGISCEMLATPNAVTTYNYLVNDSVHVAGAFVPVRNEVVMTDKDEAYIAKDIQNIDGKNFLSQHEESRERDDWESRLYKKTLGREMKKDKFDE